MPKLRLFEAFAGVGSQRMALRNIGADFESVGIMEVDRYGLLSYAAIHEGLTYDVSDEGLPSDAEMLEYMRKLHIAYNFSTGKDELPKEHMDIVRLYVASKRAKNYGDIRLVDEKELPDMDFFTYSFPCKDFSAMGKHRGAEKGSGTASSLVWECERIIAEKRPKFLMMENVKGMTFKKNIHILTQWCSILKEYGYTNHAMTLCGSNYGVPQMRKRLIMFSIKDEVTPFEFDIGSELNATVIQDILLDPVDERYYIDKFNPKVLDKPTIKRFIDVTDTSLNIVAKTNTPYNAAMVVLNWDSVCRTVIATCGGVTQATPTIKVRLKNGRMRVLLPQEYWRLQGFLDSDYFAAAAMNIDELHLYERAGRGIVVPMLMAQYRRLFKEYL